MRPSGDGDREISRRASETLLGERNPLDALPLVCGGEAGIIGLDRRGPRRCRVEFLEGVSSTELLDLPDPDRPSEGPGVFCRRAADRVTGARYSSRASGESGSEGVGDVTLVSGTILELEDMACLRSVKGGSDGAKKRPSKGRAQVFALSPERLMWSIDGCVNGSMMGGWE